MRKQASPILLSEKAPTIQSTPNRSLEMAEKSTAESHSKMIRNQAPSQRLLYACESAPERYIEAMKGGELLNDSWIRALDDKFTVKASENDACVRLLYRVIDIGHRLILFLVHSWNAKFIRQNGHVLLLPSLPAAESPFLGERSSVPARWLDVYYRGVYLSCIVKVLSYQHPDLSRNILSNEVPDLLRDSITQAIPPFPVLTDFGLKYCLLDVHVDIQSAGTAAHIWGQICTLCGPDEVLWHFETPGTIMKWMEKITLVIESGLSRPSAAGQLHYVVDCLRLIIQMHGVGKRHFIPREHVRRQRNWKMAGLARVIDILQVEEHADIQEQLKLYRIQFKEDDVVSVGAHAYATRNRLDGLGN